MFRLIPPPLHRVLLVHAHRVRLVWWRLRKPLLQGCRVVARDHEGRILLIRHSYGSGNWTLPGGGLRRGEDPIRSAQRELVEETGCQLRNARLVAVLEETLAGTVNRVHIVSGDLEGQPRPDGREVIELGLFAPAALPAPLARVVENGLENWLDG